MTLFEVIICCFRNMQGNWEEQVRAYLNHENLQQAHKLAASLEHSELCKSIEHEQF